MSEENIDLVLEGFTRFEAGERDIEERWHANGVLTGPDGWPEQGPFEGHEAIRAQFERLGADYAETRFTDVEVLADQGEWVVVHFTWRTRGSASNIETAADMAAALRVKDGRFLEGHYRWHAEDALEAAGLSE
jgi:ketosteroid isomerase-like protein